jgi:hypothetical protein
MRKPALLLAFAVPACFVPADPTPPRTHGEFEGLTPEQAAEAVGISADEVRRFTPCQLECIEFSTAGCKNISDQCDGQDPGSAVAGPQIGPYQTTCGAALKLACGGIPELHACMTDCGTWWQRALDSL